MKTRFKLEVLNVFLGLAALVSPLFAQNPVVSVTVKNLETFGEKLPAVAEDQNAVLRLRKCSSAYRLSATNKTCLEKVFNRGMGQTHFVDVDTRNKTVYYNAAVARRADIQNIRETWPNYAAVPVCLPYYETTPLKSYYLRQNKN